MEKQIEKGRMVYKVLIKASDTSILVGDLAKVIKQNGYDIGQNRLFGWLRENGYLMKLGEKKNLPTQRAMELGLFEIEQRIIQKIDGKKKIVMTTKVTDKGKKYFINKFINKNI